MVENLISSGVEDHTFGPMNLRERFPEDELTLGKNRFLEVASLVECDFFHFPFSGFPNEIQGNIRMVSICHKFENIVQKYFILYFANKNSCRLPTVVDQTFNVEIRSGSTANAVNRVLQW